MVAPGKLVLLGEYAVLDGAPALVAAVNRGVRCTVSPGSGLATPGDDRFVRAALVGAPEAFYSFADDHPVPGIDGKPGFGGSAAATVAATLAAGFPAGRAYAVHAQVQGGGSGIDVFASINGGIRRFTLADAPPDRRASSASPTIPDPQRAAPRGLPAEIPAPPMIAVWSGRSAATGSRVAAYGAWRDRSAFVARSSELVEAFSADPIRVLRDAYELLRGMAAGAGIAYDLPAFTRIDHLARDFGGAAKPSGAGGGDIAVACFPDTERRAAFAAACRAGGFDPIAVEVAAAAAWVAPDAPGAG